MIKKDADKNKFKKTGFFVDKKPEPSSLALKITSTYSSRFKLSAPKLVGWVLFFKGGVV